MGERRAENSKQMKICTREVTCMQIYFYVLQNSSGMNEGWVKLSRVFSTGLKPDPGLVQHGIIGRINP